MTEYIHTPPPSEKYFIVYDNSQTIKHYGTLNESSTHLGYALDNIELFTDKQLWINRLDELNIYHEESI